MSDSWIMRNTGMDKNELLRFKQISGLAELFRDRSFGLSDDWLEEWSEIFSLSIESFRM